MKTTIIYAHPDTSGNNPLILKEVIEMLKKKKHHYNLVDLYKEEYDPVMHEDEHYTAGRYEKSKKTLEYQKLITESEKLIFIYPVWWNSMPAMLKGFMDKVITPRFAYRFEKGRPIGLLKGKKAAVFLTTGSNRLITAMFLRNRFKALIRKDLLGFCGIKARVFHVDKALKVDERQKKKIKKTVLAGIRWLYR